MRPGRPESRRVNSAASAEPTLGAESSSAPSTQASGSCQNRIRAGRKRVISKYGSRLSTAYSRGARGKEVADMAKLLWNARMRGSKKGEIGNSPLNFFFVLDHVAAGP